MTLLTLVTLALVITFALFAVRALLAPRATQPRQQNGAREGGEGVGVSMNNHNEAK